MKRAVLPCTGQHRPECLLASEFALILSEAEGAELICSGELSGSPTSYEKTLAESSLLVIDGCATRCASKLANKLGLKVNEKVLVSERAKSAGLEVDESLQPRQAAMRLVEIMTNEVNAPKQIPAEETTSDEFDSPADFITVTYGKFLFRIPIEGYLFNENDCWVRVIGNRVRVGVSDFVQQNMTDITYFEPAEVGKHVEQFDEVGSLESGKSMMDALSPVSGQIVAVNSQLVDSPELVNADPYGRGWIAEIEIQDFDSDKELLLSAEAYSRIVEKKAAEAGH